MTTRDQEEIEFHSAIEFNECAICKKCCVKIDEGVCGYNTMLEILLGNIPTELVNHFCIFRIAEKDLDILAKDWVLYPWINILPLITKPVNKYYEFLMLPRHEEGCPFLTPQGCKYPNIKLFDCRTFPFYYFKGEFYSFEQCAYAHKLNLEEMRENLRQTTQEFIDHSKANRELYFENLQILKNKYGLKEL